MARPAQALQVSIVVGTALCFWLDMVHARGLLQDPLLKMFLAKSFVALQYPSAYDFPLRPIASLMPGLSGLVLLPSLAFVGFAVT